MASLDQKMKAIFQEMPGKIAPSANDISAYMPQSRCWILRPRPLGVDKTLSWWVGPCLVLKRLSAHTYQVQMSDTTTRDVHVAQMKPYQPDFQGASWPLHFTRDEPLDTHALEGDWDVEAILAHRRDPACGYQFLTKWAGCDDSENTWEPPSSFLQRFNAIWAGYCKQHHLHLDVLDHLKAALA